MPYRSAAKLAEVINSRLLGSVAKQDVGCYIIATSGRIIRIIVSHVVISSHFVRNVVSMSWLPLRGCAMETAGQTAETWRATCVHQQPASDVLATFANKISLFVPEI